VSIVPHNPNIDLQVQRGAGLHLRINGRPVDDTYGVMVMAELAALRERFPQVRVDVAYRCAVRPSATAMAHLIADELNRNEIWE